MHGPDHLNKASDVAASHETGQLAVDGGDVCLGGLETLGEDVLHDVLELLVDPLGSPGEALRETELVRPFFLQVEYISNGIWLTWLF